MKPTLNPRFAKWNDQFVATAVSSEGYRVVAEAMMSIDRFACCPEDGMALMAELSSLNPLALELHAERVKN